VIRKIFAALGAAIMVLATLLAAPAASAARLIVPTRLGAASQASTWPDQWQRSLQDLKVVGSEVFYGWGSYDANIGPVQVGSLNIASGAETIAFILNGEEADVLRRYGGALFVPDMRPRPVAGTMRRASRHSTSSTSPGTAMRRSWPER
jgi:hypothetical protein